MWHILLELAPWLLVGVAIAGALHALLPADFMRRHLAGRWSVVKAAALGVPLPLCSCSVIPIGLSLKKQGASSGASIAFLISTPQTGLDSIMVSGALLGLPFALFKMGSAFVIGLAGGVLTDALAPPMQTELEVAAPSCQVRTNSRWRTMLVHSVMLLRMIWRWLAVGVVASAAITYFLPPDALARLGANGGVWAMLLALVIGMPLYVCAIASVPIAAALVHGGFPAGAALVFLIAGPASNLATMGAVYRGLGRGAFAIYMLTIAVGSLACGWAFQSLIDLSSIPAAGPSHEAHDTHGWWAIASAVALLTLAAWFAGEELLAAFRSKSQANEPAGPLYTIGDPRSN